MADFNNNRPAAPSNALKDSKLKLVGDAHEKAVIKYDKPQPPTLQWGIKDNQPRAIVYTNVEGDKQDGKIEAAMDAITFEAILEAIRTYASGELVDGKQIVGFPCIGYLWTGNGKSEKPMVLSTVFVGLNRDNVVVLSVQSSDKSRPKVSFKLFPSEWHGGVDQNGQALSNQAVSKLYAKGYANLIGGIVNQLLVNEHISWEQIRDRKGKGNGQSGGGFNRNNGGNNRGGYSGGGNNNASRQNNYSNNPEPASGGGGFDDDIPFN